MGKKGKGKGKKGKKGPEDWGKLEIEKYVLLEVRNSVWQSMRFTTRLPTSTKIKAVVALIMDRHRVASAQGMSLYLGEQVDETALLRPEEYGLALKDVKVPGGSINDYSIQVRGWSSPAATRPNQMLIHHPCPLDIVTVLTTAGADIRLCTP